MFLNSECIIAHNWKVSILSPVLDEYCIQSICRKFVKVFCHNYGFLAIKTPRKALNFISFGCANRGHRAMPYGLVNLIIANTDLMLVDYLWSGPPINPTLYQLLVFSGMDTQQTLDFYIWLFLDLYDIDFRFTIFCFTRYTVLTFFKLSLWNSYHTCISLISQGDLKAAKIFTKMRNKITCRSFQTGLPKQQHDIIFVEDQAQHTQWWLL